MSLLHASIKCASLQVVDDLLDFTQTAEQLGKPRYQDIASGNLTAPTLFAMQKSPELLELMESEFVEEGSIERAVALVEANGGAPSNLFLYYFILLQGACIGATTWLRAERSTFCATRQQVASAIFTGPSTWHQNATCCALHVAALHGRLPLLLSCLEL